jgi:WD40 repeat protein
MDDHEGIIQCVRFSPNGNFIASVSNIDGGPFIWSPGILKFSILVYEINYVLKFLWILCMLLFLYEQWIASGV